MTDGFVTRVGVGLSIGSLGLALGMASGGCGGDGGNTVGSSGSTSGSSSSGSSTSGTSSGSSPGSGTSSGSNPGSGTSSGSNPGSGTSSGSNPGSGVATSGGDGGSTSGSSGEGGPGTAETAGTKITFPVGWPVATAVAAAGTGNIVIWFLDTHTVAADGSYTGVTKTCRSTLPDLTLNSLAALVVCPSGQSTCKVQIQLTDAMYDAVSRTFPISGVEGAPGGMMTEAKNLGGLGLVAGGKYLSSASPAAWPADCPTSATTCNSVGSFAMADLVNDDPTFDMHLGIAATPLNGMGYVLPPTGTGNGAMNAADKVYVAVRQEIELTGTRSTDGKTATGTAKLTLFDNHVVGCHTMAGNDCTSAQAAFVDAARTKYTTQAAYMMSSPPAISASNPIMGTYTTTQLMSGATCADVRSL